ncbi:MAG: hypothetical protein E6J26_00540 [Chloroflexi bacterium]|nr:MAG: hypothetical protein E6J26_00540 [Chloroflexota bacterium]
MSNFANTWNRLAQALQNTPRTSPSTITIPRDHVDLNPHGELDSAFKAGQHYFQVLVNEMYLTKQRQWLDKIDPLVYAVCEFNYDNKPQVMPFVVGPGMLKRLGVPDQYANGIIFRNTSISGIRPYRGGGLTLSIVLCEASVGNYVTPLLRVIESAANALDFSPALSPYMKVATLVMDGFESLFNTGGIKPLVGLRDSFGPNFGTPFRPTYFALIDAPNVNPQSLWVRDNQLVEGAELHSAKPYRQADFVLYSIVVPSDNKRDDVDALPFGDLWGRVKKDAASPVDKPDYESAKTNMAALYQSILLSPDMTEPQADELADQYAKRMQSIHERAVSIGHMDGEVADTREQARLAQARSKSLAILKS